MKKLCLFSVCMLVCGMQLTATPRILPKAETQVATFEDLSAGIQEIWGEGVNQWQSGDFTFTTYKDANGEEAYYYSFVVSDETANTSTGWLQPYRSTSGGAYEGDHFCVWYADFNGNNSVTFAAQTVPGFFVNNNAYTVAAFVEGNQSPARIFRQDDLLLLYAIGKKEGQVIDTVTVGLAADGRYIADWTYVDLSVLGEIDEVEFAMFSTDRTSYDNGVTYYDNTPTYFCLDNFGAAMPEGYVAPEPGIIPVQTALDETANDTRAEKVMLNGRLMIRRDGVIYDLQGGRQ